MVSKGFPEEGALMLRDFEYELLGQTTTIQLIRGLAKVLTMKTSDDPNHVQALLQFQKIVSHFYLVIMYPTYTFCCCFVVVGCK